MDSRNSNTFYSKEDQTQQISKSVFITNFPDHTRAKDLWELCNAYGSVVDVYIPFKKSKAGKRFAFIRFIKVNNFERLIQNLCTIWIGSFRLHANLVRFQREHVPMVSPLNKETNSGTFKKNISKSSCMGNSRGSFASILKGGTQDQLFYAPSSPALVLDDSCLNERDFSNSLMGQVKDVSSIPNLYIILSKEGFHDTKISYLGGLWVLVSFDLGITLEKFRNHVGIGSWFSFIKPACNLFVADERIIWVSIEGKVYWIRVKELDAWVPNFFYDKDNYSFDGSYESDEGSKFEEKDIGNSKRVSDAEVDKVSEISFMQENDLDEGNEPNSKKGGNISKERDSTSVKNHSSSNTSSHIKVNTSSYMPITGGSILDVMDDLIKINFVALQETKIESIYLFSIKKLWGNYTFDHAISSSVGNLGGILCVWDSNLFAKDHVSSTDYFLAIMGTWLPSSTKLLVISVYAPQEVSEKRDMWGYLCSLIDRWDGEVVVLGLIDLPMGGYSYTWAHKSAFKMSKLDRFLISEGLMELFSNLSDLDQVIDRGGWDDKVLKNRASLLNDLNDITSKEALDLSQKAKIRWSIEGDENSKFYHGVLNSKRSQLTIRGILREGDWIEEPSKKIKAMIFKVDFEKAFDSFRWDYLDDVLKSFGFGDKWCSWISSYLRSAKGSILINGSPTSEFQFHKGEWDISNIKTIVNVLNCFFMALGLKVNLLKSKLSGIGIRKADSDLAASMVGYSTSSFPFHYLGVKVGASMSRISSWKEIIDKISSRLSKWKSKILSIGGRLTLLKLVLTALPLYYISLYKAPDAVRKKLEAIQRNFLLVLTSLIGKWCGFVGILLWFLRTMVALASQVSMQLIELFNLNGFGDLSRNLPLFSLISSKLFMAIKELGNGENMVFWEDKWLGGSTLKLTHPRLFAMELDKGINVADKLSHSSLAFSLRRFPRSGAEEEQYNNLAAITSDVILS
ncbi:RNA-directed DNA polymerase, eukaryota [Tanacetum coccineum]